METGLFDDLLPQQGDTFSDLQPGAMLRGEKPVDGGFFAAAKQSGGSLLKGAGQFAADFIPGVSDDNVVKRYGQEVIAANPTAVQSLSDIADKPLTAIKEATGNAAGSMAGIVGSRLLGQGITAAAPLTGPAAPVVAAVGQGISLLGPYAAAALPSFGSIREKQQSDTPEDKAIAALGAGTVGLIENKFGPQEWALSAMTKAGRDQLAERFAAKTLTGSIAKGIGTGAAVEGGEELVQNPIEQLASYQDPRTPENLADTAFSGAMGAIGGGVVGGPMAGLSHRQPQPVTVPRQDGQGEALIDPATGPLSAAAADHVTRTQTDQDLFADMMPAAPVDSAIEPQQVSGSMFDDLIPADEPISPLLSWQQETDPVSLEEAQAVVQQARDAGYDGHAVIRHGNGFTAVPKEWLNTDQVKAAELLQPAPAKDLFADLPTTIDQPASQANTAPTEAQIAAGNYQKGHIKVGSLDIAIENPVGSTRTGPGWATTMQDHYGYMKRTEGADGDQVDVYVKQGTPTDHSGPVFVVDQYDPATGKFDEHKAMVGYVFKGAALKAYDAHFSDGSGPSRRKGVTKMTAEEFKTWAQNGDTQAPAATLKVAPEVAKSGKPRLAETADDLWRTIKAQTDSGVVFGGQILYPVVDTLGSGEFRISSKGIDKIGREGTATPATKGEIAELHDAIEKDQAQVHLLTRWGGSGRATGQRVAQILHSPSGNSFGAATKAPATIQDFGEKIGGARKDLAQPTGPKAKAAPTPAETEPVWQRRFQPLQNMLRSDETWNLIDTKTGKPVRGAEFKSEQAAKDAIPLIAVAQKHRVVSVKDGFEIMRDVTDRKRVKVVDQVFPTRDAAMAYMASHAQAIIETKTSFREELFARPEKVMRDGAQRRTGPASAEDFSKMFGFRGVGFGNWNNQDERQEVMNHAYDGLLDLAEVLGVPPKALSLNGDLALAFGARGQGLSGAIAHYERGHAVINLTKMQGAGALAHEWFHALDHYFGRQDGKASSEKIQNKRGDQVFETDGTGDYASHGLSLKSKMREELQARYKALIQTMTTKAERYVEDTAKAEKFVGSTRDTLVKSLTAMRKQLEKAPEWQKRNNKPATAEQLAEFDRLAADLVEGRAFQLETRSSEPRQGRRFGNIRLSNDQLDALSALFKAVRGRNGMKAEGTGIVDGIRSDLRRYAERVRMLEEARSGNEKTKSVPTEFAMNAKRIDQGSATDYWTTPHEMAARAFSAYVEDKLPGRSDFLSYGSNNAMPEYRLFNVRPFPEGAERVAIGQAFDDFVGALKTRETEKGVELYSQIDRDKRVASFNQAANQQLDDWAAGRLKSNAIIELGHPSSVLLKFGMPDLPMHLTQAVLRKAVTDKHDVDAADLKDITFNVQAPIAVFGSKRGEGHLVVVTEARHADGNIVVALDLDVQRDGIGINDVRSIHPKRDGSIAHWITDGLLLGLEKRKGRDWLENSAGSNSQQPQVKAALDKATIYDAGSIRNADPDGAQAQFDQLLFDMASAPWGDVRTILTSIEQGSANAFNRELASLLLSQNLATTIKTATFDGEHSGGYNPQTDVVSIMQAADAEQTVLHELMHASTVRALSNKSVAAGAMRALLKEVRQHLGLDSHYGLTDVREFVAEAFTSSQFQDVLRQIPVKASGIRGKIANAWGRFVSTVRHLLGLDRDQETALGKALELGARLMQENQTAPLRNYMGEIIGNQAKPTRHLIGQATNQIYDLFANSGGRFSWLHKTVGTQYHKAQIDRHFKKVFDLGQKYLLDTSRFAMDAADKAPSLLMKLESLRDIFSAKTAKRSDVEAIADPLFAGTLENMVWSNAELRDRFGLNATQIGLFREARAAIGKSLDDLGISEMAQVTKAVLPGIDLERVKGADLVTARDYLHITLNREADIQRLNGQEDTAKALESAAGDVLQNAKHIVDLKADGYVPMMRFGKFAVDVVGADGERQFFGMYETRREANQAARALQVAYPTAEVTQGQLDTETWRLFQGLDPSSLEVFAKALGAEEKVIYQDFLKLTINNRSAMKRLLAQKGTEGYSRDVQRILASFVTSNARLAAKNYHFSALKQAVLDIPKVKGDVRNEAAKLVEYLQNPQEEAAGLRSYLFTHFLGGSVASALVNMTQPLTMTAPYLAQYGNAATALAKAGKLLASGRYDAELRDAMQLAEREGITAPHELHQLFAESMQTLGRNALVRRGLHAWGSFFALAEQFNRKLTFIAAFEIARQNGEANPFAFAQKAVEETQGIYNRGNRPNWARGAIGATVFTFRQFSVSYIEFLRRLWKSDKRAFAIAMAVLFVGAGAEGWPFAEDLEDLIDTVGQFAGFGTNSKAWLRENATKVFGELGGEIFRKGISALLPIDLSSRLGVQNLIPGSALAKVSETDKTRDMLEFVGPFGGFVSAALRGFEAARTGDLAGAVTMAAPVAIQNALKGQDMAAWGFYRDTKGRRVVDTDGYDAFAKSIGFQPSIVARESAKIREQQQNVAQHRAIETEIADLWAHGVFERDEAKVKDAVSRLKAWNERNPEMPIRIVPRQIGERVKAMAMSREQRFAKLVPKELRGMLK